MEFWWESSRLGSKVDCEFKVGDTIAAPGDLTRLLVIVEPRSENQFYQVVVMHGFKKGEMYLMDRETIESNYIKLDCED